MANPIILLDATMTIGPSTLDISPWLKKLELSDEYEVKKTTNFRSGGAEENKGGLESFDAVLTLNQDYDAAALDEVMWALRRSTVTFAARAQQAAVTASNPQYSGKIVIAKWVPISGSVGDLGEVDVTFPGSGPLARVTAT